VRFCCQYRERAHDTSERRGSTARAHLPATRSGWEKIVNNRAVSAVDTGRWRRIVRPHSTDRWRNSRSALFLQELLAFVAHPMCGAFVVIERI